MHRRMAVLAALTLTLVAGCGEAASEPAAQNPTATSPETAATPTAATETATTPTADDAPWYDKVPPAQAAGTVGGRDSACHLPLVFSLAEGTKATRIEIPDDVDDEIRDVLTRQGGATVVCEVDAKPIKAGFLRVWSVDEPKRRPRPAVESFVAAVKQVDDPQYRTVKTALGDAVEATWISTPEMAGESRREFALAVRASGRTVLLSSSESLIAEIEDVLSVFRLAVRTVAPTG
ncbi:lipoprotein [Micromonospora sp. NPDC000207]|uniref:lipoprotein n=1 Tax=Micromonospora sp. NPDC000207 TaxID=3154246 RepID=UPI0033215AD5